MSDCKFFLGHKDISLDTARNSVDELSPPHFESLRLLALSASIHSPQTFTSRADVSEGLRYVS